MADEIPVDLLRSFEWTEQQYLEAKKYAESHVESLKLYNGDMDRLFVPGIRVKKELRLCLVAECMYKEELLKLRRTIKISQDASVVEMATFMFSKPLQQFVLEAQKNARSYKKSIRNMTPSTKPPVYPSKIQSDLKAIQPKCEERNLMLCEGYRRVAVALGHLAECRERLVAMHGQLPTPEDKKFDSVWKKTKDVVTLVITGTNREEIGLPPVDANDLLGTLDWDKVSLPLKQQRLGELELPPGVGECGEAQNINASGAGMADTLLMVTQMEDGILDDGPQSRDLRDRLEKLANETKEQWPKDSGSSLRTFDLIVDRYNNGDKEGAMKEMTELASALQRDTTEIVERVKASTEDMKNIGRGVLPKIMATLENIDRLASEPALVGARDPTKVVNQNDLVGILAVAAGGTILISGVEVIPQLLSLIGYAYVNYALYKMATGMFLSWSRFGGRVKRWAAVAKPVLGSLINQLSASKKSKDSTVKTAQSGAEKSIKILLNVHLNKPDEGLVVTADTNGADLERAWVTADVDDIAKAYAGGGIKGGPEIPENAMVPYQEAVAPPQDTAGKKKAGASLFF